MTSRRKILQYGTLSLLAPWSLNSNAGVVATPWLRNSDDSLGVQKLTPQVTNWHLFDDLPSSSIWSYKQDSFAPIIHAKQGEELSVKVDNNLPESTTVHWHGIRVPNEMDGVPTASQPAIGQGDSFTYSYLPQDAGTYWYHPHINSTEQVSRGLVGPLVVHEQQDYPVDRDVVLVLNDWLLNDDMSLSDNFYSRMSMSHDGRFGNVSTVNGRYNPRLRFRPYERVRLRFINAASGRFFRPDFLNIMTANLIAIDGQPVAPRPYKGLTLAPGMRCDVVVDMGAGAKGDAVQIADSAYKPVRLMQIQVDGQPVRNSSLTTMPQQLPRNPLAQPDLRRAKSLNLSLEGGAMSMSMMKGMATGMFWSLNGRALKTVHSDTKPLMNLELNQSYRIKIKNNTNFAHPMHLHGHTFKVLNEEPYWTDTALLLPGKETEIAFVADNPGTWMLHCHVLSHQASGMMATVEVS